MKKQHSSVCNAVLCGLSLLPATALAQSFGGHYPIGVEGIKGGTLPPPGFYIRDYNQFYFADRLNDPQSRAIGDLDLFAYAQAFRPVWITDLQLAGGHYGMDVLVPLIFTDFSLEVGGGKMSDSSFGLGDLFVEPVTLSWHWQKADFGVGYGFWAPTGHTSLSSPAKPGKGFWSHMFTLGGTWYPDVEKTWSVSILNRYEIHMEHEDIEITPGNTFSLEFGIAKALTQTLELGVAGYYQQQTTEDDGDAPHSKELDRVFGVGPEIVMAFPKCALFASLRYAREFGAEDRPEGNTVTLTLTKKF
ncbi:MAG: SphA family protein [Verrucomicrobiia bacterium]